MGSELVRIYPGVSLGDDGLIEDFVIIGRPAGAEQEETTIGAGYTIRSHTVIYAGNRIGSHFQTGHHALIREGNIIGDDVSVGSLSVVEHHVKIGSGVRIHSQAFIPEYTVLEDHCWIGPRVVMTNAKFPRGRHVKDALKGPTIMERAIIGANATLLPGVVIGARAVVGAGSVVVSDVPAGAVVAGNPARIIKRIHECSYEDPTLSRPYE